MSTPTFDADADAWYFPLDYPAAHTRPVERESTIVWDLDGDDDTRVVGLEVICGGDSDHALWRALAQVFEERDRLRRQKERYEHALSFIRSHVDGDHGVSFHDVATDALFKDPDIKYVD